MLLLVCHAIVVPRISCHLFSSGITTPMRKSLNSGAGLVSLNPSVNITPPFTNHIRHQWCWNNSTQKAQNAVAQIEVLESFAATLDLALETSRPMKGGCNMSFFDELQERKSKGDKLDFSSLSCEELDAAGRSPRGRGVHPFLQLGTPTSSPGLPHAGRSLPR